VEIVRPHLDVLLQTKLQAPRVRREWVPRPGLVRALDDLESKLILVDAPAGYGKTTLLAQWGYAAAALPAVRVDLTRSRGRRSRPALAARHLLAAACFP